MSKGPRPLGRRALAK